MSGVTFELPYIKTKTDLSKLVKSMRNQGFGYINEFELLNSKIDDIMQKNNKLNIKFDKDKLKNDLNRFDDYDEMNNAANAFFSKFSVNDKIEEFIIKFHIIQDDGCRTPSYYHSNLKEIIEWVNFKTKYNLKDEFGASQHVDYYNLDKNYLKFSFGEYNSHEFKKLYNFIFNEECPDFNQKTAGVWQNINKLQIKFFINGAAYIKGELDKYKELYYQYILKRNYSSTVIKYNGKIEKITKREN